LDWIAWQLQNLGKKSTTSLVIVGPPGIGKGWLTRIMELIYGAKNVSKIPIGVLDKNFNAEVAEKQLLIVEETDEVSGKNQVIYNKLKDMITSTTIRLEKKGLDATFIPNVVNVFLTGNQVGIFKLDTDDRRFAIFDASNIKGIANNSEYWRPRWEWVEREGGASAVYAHLLQRDVSGFDAYASAPMTQAKQDMIEVTHADLDKWVQELKVDYKSIMHVQGVEVDGRLATSKELMWVYLGGDRPIQDITKKESEAMGRALKNARVPVASGGGKIKAKGVSNRYFLLGGEDRSDNWAGEVEARTFWVRLVASNRGEVARGSNGGNQESKW
jgi:hypothetical protein